MSFIKNLKNRFASGLKNNLSLAIYSIIIAIIAWFVVSMTIYPSIPKTIENIPVVIDITGTPAAENGLSLISCDLETVDVKILGNRAQIGNLTNDNLEARVVTDNVTSAGTKKLSLEILCNDDSIEFAVESISHETATVVFDKFVTKEFSLAPEIPNITFAEGKIIDSGAFSCEPDIIKITGPEAQLNKISKCVAVTNKELQIDTSYSVPADELKLYAEDGATIEKSSFKFDTAASGILVNIPVLTQKTVELSVGLSGVPSNFDTSSLKFELSTDSIIIASQNSQLNEIPDKLEIGPILLSDLDLGYAGSFPIDTKEYTNMSNVNSVTVTLDDSELDKKEITLGQEQLTISNLPDDKYDYSVVTKQLDIAIIGPADVIADITAGDIVANANLFGGDNIPQSDSFSYSVSISCPNYDNVWAVTNSKITIQKTPKVEETVAVDDITDE